MIATYFIGSRRRGEGLSPDFMHEFSLCEGIIEAITTQTRQQGFSRVRRVWLEIGALANVELDALRFRFRGRARKYGRGYGGIGHHHPAGPRGVSELHASDRSRRIFRSMPALRRLSMAADRR